LQWHTAFYAGIQIEPEPESENLIFENEHMRGTKPLQIDVLITKKDTARVNEIKCEEVSLSFVSLKYPRKLIKHLLSRAISWRKSKRVFITSMERSLQSSFWCVPGCRRKKISG